MREPCLAMKAQRENAARRAHIYALAFQCCGVALAVSGNDLRGRRSLLKFTRVGVVAKRFDFGEFFLALEVLVERFERQRGFPFCSSAVYRCVSRSVKKTLALVTCDIIGLPAGGAVLEDAIANRGLPRTASVHEDWVAWLPEEKDRLFDA